MRSILVLVINLCIFLIIVASYGSYLDAVIVSTIIFVAFFGDNLLKLYDNYILRAFIDSCTHGLIGLLSWIIVTLHRGSHYNKYEVILCGILSSLIDLDHFFKAKSLRLKDALHIVGGRPILHCSSIPLIIFFINIFTVGFFGLRSSRWVRFGWLSWTALTSHHVRDANRRGLWFYPIGSTPPLPNVLYILIILLLPYLTVFFMSNNLFKYLPFNQSDLYVRFFSTSGTENSVPYSGVHIV